MKALYLRLFLYVFLPLAAGFLVYYFYRPDIAFFRWTGWSVHRVPPPVLLPSWFTGCFPDTCWAFAFTSSLLLWRRYYQKHITILPLVIFLFLAAAEIIQLLPGLPFTFDPLDLLATAAGFLLSWALNR